MSERRNEIEVAFVRSARCLQLEVPAAVYADFAEKCRAYMGNLAEAYRERDALAVRVETLETTLRKLLNAYVAASEHIVEDLQPEFEKLAETGELSWPKSWRGTPYDESQAAWRLATWWHGVGFDELVGEAKAALAGLSVGPADDKEAPDVTQLSLRRLA